MESQQYIRLYFRPLYFVQTALIGLSLMSMSKNSLTTIIAFLAFFLLSINICVAENTRLNEGDAQAQQLIIAHPEVEAPALNLNELRSIFSMRARLWPDGSPITVVVLGDQHRTHRQFLTNTLKMLPHQLRRHWDRYIYSGIGQGPIQVNNQEQMIRFISTTPGAIGYINTGVPHEQVQTLELH